MKTKLSKEENLNLTAHIAQVLATGQPWEDESLHYPVETIVDAILEFPGMARKPIEDGRYGVEGFDTNGWQWDWWQHFTHKGKSYTLSGSGYYGGHSFQLDED